VFVRVVPLEDVGDEDAFLLGARQMCVLGRVRDN
jgi:hypothetical protein